MGSCLSTAQVKPTVEYSYTFPTNSKSGYDKVTDTLPKTDEKVKNEEYSQSLNDDENDMINPLNNDNNSNQNTSLLSVGQSTKRLLNMDSNANPFGDRWDDGKGFEWNENEETFRNNKIQTEMKTNSKRIEKTETLTLDSIMQYPTRRDKPPSSEQKPISDKYPAINTPNEALLALNESDWALFEKIRQKYGDKLNVLYPDDLLRFVQGYCHETERETETFKRIDELLKRGFSFDEHKDQWDFQHILDDAMPDNEEKECLKAWPVFMYGYDKEGHPIMYDEIGCSNPADLDECFDGKIRKLKTFRFRVLRRLHNTKRIQNMRYGYDASVNDKGGVNLISKNIMVMNMKNFYAKALTAKYRNLVKDIVGDESNLWPNTLDKMYIVNAPWPFRFAWKVVSNFVHPITVEKINILDANYIETMKKHIDLEQIPKSYGGTGELAIKYGYTADIDNDILDGYYLMNDPIDLNTVSCNKNKNRPNDKDKSENN